MQLSKGLITRDEAVAISPDYVSFVEGNFYAFDAVDSTFAQLKRGQEAITYHDKKFYRVKVSSVNHKSYQAVDGPVVRVSNGEYSWRVDGDKFAFPISV